jgi:hypothetical protein
VNMINVLNRQTFIIVGGSLYDVLVTCEHIVISIVVYVISHVNVETMIALKH